jgi:hypothetical protein
LYNIESFYHLDHTASDKPSAETLKYHFVCCINGHKIDGENVFL